MNRLERIGDAIEAAMPLVAVLLFVLVAMAVLG